MKAWDDGDHKDARALAGESALQRSQFLSLGEEMGCLVAVH